MAIDPVCHMKVEEQEAAGTSTYQGQTYLFCSVGCKEEFDTDPERFVKHTDLLGRKIAPK